jgi:hypothetical protein
MQTDLFSTKELAAMLKRAPSYVYAMRAKGFPMPGGRARVSEALAWLTKHPQPRAEKGHGKK